MPIELREDRERLEPTPDLFRHAIEGDRKAAQFLIARRCHPTVIVPRSDTMCRLGELLERAARATNEFSDAEHVAEGSSAAGHGRVSDEPSTMLATVARRTRPSGSQGRKRI